METAFHIGVMMLTVLVMEPCVALIHRYVMHGFGWGWHRDHHEPQPAGAWFEKNDLYAIFFVALSITLFAIAGGPDATLFWVALGITLYGLLYGLVHEGLVHRRWPFNAKIRNPYLRRLVVAHHLHHAVRGREGAVSYGFLYALPVEQLRRRLKQRHGRAAASDNADD